MRGDHTFKFTKYVRALENCRAFAAVYTIMNEYGEIVAQYFVSTKSLKEIQQALRLLAHRYVKMGLEVIVLGNILMSLPSPSFLSVAVNLLISVC